MKHAIGSSYLIDQFAGLPKVGGLEIILKRAADGAGTIHIDKTLRTPNEIWDEVQFEPYAVEAVNGVIDYAKEIELDLSKFDVTLSQFFIHDVDSCPHLYYQAGKQALQSAWSAWNFAPFPRQARS